MSIPHFDYPNSTSPTTTFIFSRGNVFPYPETRTKKQIINENENGSVKVASVGTFYRMWDLQFVNLNATDKANLSDFIENKIDVAKNTFDYTDYNDDTFTVRMIDQPVWNQTAFNLWGITFKLREEV